MLGTPVQEYNAKTIEETKPPHVSLAEALSMKKMFQTHLDKPQETSSLAEDEHLMGVSIKSQFEEAAARQRLQIRDMQPAEGTQIPKDDRESTASGANLVPKVSLTEPGSVKIYLERTEVLDTARSGGEGGPEAEVDLPTLGERHYLQSLVTLEMLQREIRQDIQRQNGELSFSGVAISNETISSKIAKCCCQYYVLYTVNIGVAVSPRSA